MKKCLIAAGGQKNFSFVRNFLKDRTYDLVIAADAGLEILHHAGLTPDKIVGDLDSVSKELLKEYEEDPRIRFERFKPEKDETDMELALLRAEEAGCTEVDLLGALGGRMDHALGNIQLMLPFFERGVLVNIYDEQNRIYLLEHEKKFRKSELYGTYVSFLPLTETVEGLTLTGFKYPLTDRTIRLGSSLCISNELEEDEGTAVFQSGVLCCVEAGE